MSFFGLLNCTTFVFYDLSGWPLNCETELVITAADELVPPDPMATPADGRARVVVISFFEEPGGWSNCCKRIPLSPIFWRAWMLRRTCTIRFSLLFDSGCSADSLFYGLCGGLRESSGGGERGEQEDAAPATTAPGDFGDGELRELFLGEYLFDWDPEAVVAAAAATAAASFRMIFLISASNNFSFILSLPYFYAS